jgi:propanol-preferring alcohol dehydrogenase
MRAAQLIDYGKPIEIKEIPTPTPGPGEVLVRIGGSGACHSDLHIISGELPLLPKLPWTLGHENAGWVAAVGSGVTGLELETPVAVFGGWGCGKCRLCLAGQEQLCNIMTWVGVGAPGGYAEYLIVPAARHLVHLKDLDPVKAAPLTDAGLTPYHAVRQALPRLVPGSTAVIIGVGGLGHFGLQFVRELSPARIIAVDTSAEKRALALELGADLALDPTTDDIAAEVKRGGEGAAGVFDFVGSNTTLALAASLVGRQGMVVLVGLSGGSLPYSFMGMPGESVVMGSTWGTRNELEEVLALATAGRLTFHFEQHPLEKINEVFHRLEKGEILGRAVLVP